MANTLSFDVITSLGSGTYGEVYHVQQVLKKGVGGKHYAMKRCALGHSILESTVSHEFQVLQYPKHPHLVQADYGFVTEKHCYIMLELCDISLKNLCEILRTEFPTDDAKYNLHKLQNLYADSPVTHECSVSRSVFDVPVAKQVVRLTFDVTKSEMNGANFPVMKANVHVSMISIPKQRLHSLVSYYSGLYQRIRDWVFKKHAVHNTATFNTFCEKIIGQTISALRHLHEHGFVHADLKLANVMIDVHSDSIKLIDFGMIQSIHRPYNTEYYPALVVCPYEFYSRAGVYKHSVDTWSVGCLLGSLITRDDFLNDKDYTTEHGYAMMLDDDEHDTEYGSLMRHIPVSKQPRNQIQKRAFRVLHLRQAEGWVTKIQSLDAAVETDSEADDHDQDEEGGEDDQSCSSYTSYGTSEDSSSSATNIAEREECDEVSDAESTQQAYKLSSTGYIRMQGVESDDEVTTASSSGQALTQPQATNRGRQRLQRSNSLWVGNSADMLLMTESNQANGYSDIDRSDVHGIHELLSARGYDIKRHPTIPTDQPRYRHLSEKLSHWLRAALTRDPSARPSLNELTGPLPFESSSARDHHSDYQFGVNPVYIAKVAQHCQAWQQQLSKLQQPHRKVSLHWENRSRAFQLVWSQMHVHVKGALQCETAGLGLTIFDRVIHAHKSSPVATRSTMNQADYRVYMASCLAVAHNMTSCDDFHLSHYNISGEARNWSQLTFAGMTRHDIRAASREILYLLQGQVDVPSLYALLEVMGRLQYIMHMSDPCVSDRSRPGKHPSTQNAQILWSLMQADMEGWKLLGSTEPVSMCLHLLASQHKETFQVSPKLYTTLLQLGLVDEKLKAPFDQDLICRLRAMWHSYQTTDYMKTRLVEMVTELNRRHSPPWGTTELNYMGQMWDQAHAQATYRSSQLRHLFGV